eukprot:TRINITY_DN11905_c0_g1_i8.p1 TRINITY_DN11905_c0_g1~~TRINITY_DN11905_c0_g1_i8.p1  ORF type:complete len:1294 (+),score=208.14 TRINITY_DN11905_c0_g1_i8:212-3883(+)
MEATTSASAIFFVFMVFFGAFFLINLVLAVVAMSYSTEARTDSETHAAIVPSESSIGAGAPQRLRSSLVQVKSWDSEDGTPPQAALDNPTALPLVVSSPDLDIQAVDLDKEAPDQSMEERFDPFDSVQATVQAEAEENSRSHWKKMLREIAESTTLGQVVTATIILNTITLAMYYPAASNDYKTALSACNYTWTAIFTVEMVIKILGLGFATYFKSGWNRFDCLIVATSLFEIILENVSDISGPGLSVLRSFRLMRVLKLAQSWSTMSQLMKVILDVLGQLGNLTLILLILMYMFAVIGMQLFGEAYRPARFGEDEIPRWNFTDFWHSFLLIFRILCGEWVEPLWDTMLASGYGAIAFYVVVLVVGNFIILNLFLALLLAAFDIEKIKEITTARVKEARLRKNKRSSRLMAFASSGLAGNNRIRTSITSLEHVPRSSRPSKQRPSFALNRIHPADSTKSIDRSPTRSIREYAKVIVNHPAFDNAILFLIVWSSIMLAFEDTTLDNKPTLRRVLNGLNLFFTVVFSLEAAFKITALGLRQYFRQGWNNLDFAVVLVSIIDVAATGSSLSSFRSLRTLRALRPLRAVSRWKGMKVVVDALFQSIPSIANVLLVCLLIWIIFSIVAVQFFGGTFGKCIDADGGLMPRGTVRNKEQCLNLRRQGQAVDWVNPNINFDTSWEGALALFQVATFEGWMELMECAVDSVGIDQQPQREYRMEAYVFFVVFILIGAFFTLNLFIGVIIDNFSRLKAKLEDEGQGLFLTASQRAYMDNIRKVLKGKPLPKVPKPPGPFAGWCHMLTYHEWFEYGIMAVIMLNLFVLCMEHYQQSEQWETFQLAMNVIFNSIFVAEAIIKLTALGSTYFKDSWNIFDFGIVIIGLIGLCLDLLATSVGVNTTVLRVLRMSRIVRILRLVKRAQGLKRLLATLILSGPALLNVGTLLFLVIFIFSIIGMNLFGHVAANGVLNDFHNFRTFGASMVLLFRLATGGGWNDVLDACSLQPPGCNQSFEGLPNGNCGDPTAAKTFFPIYIMLTFLIIVNMYIAVILENLSAVTNEDKQVIRDADIDHFYVRWREFDPYAQQRISYERLPDFLHSLDPPLHVEDTSLEQLGKLDLPLYQDAKGEQVHCLDVLHALANRIITRHGVVDEEELKPIEAVIRSRFSKAFPQRRKLNQSSSTSRLATETAAAIVIQRAVREVSIPACKLKTMIQLDSCCRCLLDFERKTIDQK